MFLMWTYCQVILSPCIRTGLQKKKRHKEEESQSITFFKLPEGTECQQVINSTQISRRSRQLGAQSHHSAGSVGSTVGASRRAWACVTGGHSSGRSGRDSPSGCGPGSHTGCRWDTSVDEDIFNNSAIEWIVSLWCNKNHQRLRTK